MPEVIRRSCRSAIKLRPNGSRMMEGIGEPDSVRHVSVLQQMRMHESVLVRRRCVETIARWRRRSRYGPAQRWRLLCWLLERICCLEGVRTGYCKRQSKQNIISTLVSLGRCSSVRHIP